MILVNTLDMTSGQCVAPWVVAPSRIVVAPGDSAKGVDRETHKLRCRQTGPGGLPRAETLALGIATPPTSTEADPGVAEELIARRLRSG